MGSRVYLLLTLVAYSVGAVHVVVQAWLRRKPLSNGVLVATLAGFALHTAGLSQRWTEVGRFPLSGLHDACSFLAWAVVLAFLATYLRTRVDALGLIVYPVSFALMLVASLTRPVEPDPRLDRVLFPAHGALAVAGFAALFLAAAIGLLYLLQERELRQRMAGRLYHLLPSLERCDTLTARSVTFGFGLLTAAIVSGMALSHQFRGHYWLWDAKGVSALLAWVLCVILLTARWRAGWGGRRQALLAMGAFLAIVAVFAFVTLYGSSVAPGY